MTGRINVGTSQGNTLPTSDWGQWAPDPGSSGVLTGDFNGDGLDDLIGPNALSDQWTVGRSKGNRFEQVTATVGSSRNPLIPRPTSSSTGQTISWNTVPVAAGYDFVIAMVSPTVQPIVSQVLTTATSYTFPTLPANGTYTVRVRAVMADGSSAGWSSLKYFTVGTDAWATSWTSSVVGDFNADGRDDIAFINTLGGQVIVALSNGNGFDRSMWGSLPAGNLASINTADINGDGRADLVARQQGTSDWYIATSTGSGFQVATWTWSGTDIVTKVLTGDVDGNGLDDLVVFDSIGGFWRTARSTTSGFVTTSMIAFSSSFPITSVLVDANQDGKADLVGKASNGDWHVSLSSGTSWVDQTWKRYDGVSEWFTTLTLNGVSVVDYPLEELQ